MSWDSHHTKSEEVAGQAQAEARSLNQKKAEELYRLAASEEEIA